MTIAPYEPFMVQAFRSGQFTNWTTDKRFERLEPAVAHARNLHAAFDRTVRVIDDDERIHFKLGTVKQARAKHRAGK